MRPLGSAAILRDPLWNNIRLKPPFFGDSSRPLDHRSLLRVVHGREPLPALELADLPGKIDALRHPRHELQVEPPDALAQTIQSPLCHTTTSDSKSTASEGSRRMWGHITMLYFVELLTMYRKEYSGETRDERRETSEGCTVGSSLPPNRPSAGAGHRPESLPAPPSAVGHL